MKNGKLILAALILPIAITVAVLSNNNKDINAKKNKQLLEDVNAKTAFMTTDEIADLIVKKDPSLQLIDVRKQVDFDDFHLPGAINIPLSDIYNPKYDEVFSQDSKKNVLYSNGTVDANNGWLFLRLKGYKNVFVMKGGTNYWYETQLNPEKPSDVSDNEELAKYNFRLATSQYLTGASSGPTAETTTTSKPSSAAPAGGVVKKKKRAGGGC